MISMFKYVPDKILSILLRNRKYRTPRFDTWSGEVLYTPFKAATPCKRHPVKAHSFAVSQRTELLVKQQFLGFKGKINVIVLDSD